MEEPTHPIQVRLPKSMIRQLKVYIAEHETTLTAMVHDALQRVLKEQNKKEQSKR